MPLDSRILLNEYIQENESSVTRPENKKLTSVINQPHFGSVPKAENIDIKPNFSANSLSSKSFYSSQSLKKNAVLDDISCLKLIKSVNTSSNKKRLRTESSENIATMTSDKNRGPAKESNVSQTQSLIGTPKRLCQQNICKEIYNFEIENQENSPFKMWNRNNSSVIKSGGKG